MTEMTDDHAVRCHHKRNAKNLRKSEEPVSAFIYIYICVCVCVCVY